MNSSSSKSRLEARLLEIWYGAGKPGVIESLALSSLEAIYKMLRALTRQNAKAAQSKQTTSPPLLVVGNVIAGGAGKTPIVMAVCQHMQARGKKVGIVSRGYGRSATTTVLIDPHKALPNAHEVGDEPLFLCAETHCPVAVAKDRRAALDVLLQAYPELDLVVSDDGLQHHRLKRQMEWVVFDARGPGNGRLLPAGPLREPVRRLESVDAVIASNTSITALSAALKMPATRKWHEVTVSLIGFRHVQTGEFMTTAQARTAWENQPIAAFSGIANPDKLFASIQAQGIALSLKLPLPDHFPYADDFCAQFDQPVLITTGKDAVKLSTSNSKLWVAEIQVQLPPTLTLSLEDCIGPTID